ncbi:MAG: hypothetical protein ABSE97_01580 [Verrucomicrobiota bacterium]
MKVVGEHFLKGISVFLFRWECLGFATMNGVIHRVGFLAVLLLLAVSLKANPISVNEGPVSLGIIVPVTLAILAEAVCILLLLRRWRTPHFFLLCLMGMHLLTYPVFLGLLWLSEGLRPAFAVAMGEGLIVLIEGGLIYLLCRFAPSAKVSFPMPSFLKCLFASLVGNVCSVAVFPLLMILHV